MAWDSSFVGIVEEDLNVNVRNFGVGSYSPLLHILYFQHWIAKETPDFVVIQLYSNDVEDDERYAKSTVFDTNGLPVACSGKPNLVIEGLKKSYLMRWLREKLLLVKFQLSVQAGMAKKEEVFNGMFENQEIAENSRFAKSILAFDSLLNVQGIPHVYFAVPSKESCRKKRVFHDKFDDNFKKFAEQKQLPYFD